MLIKNQTPYYDDNFTCYRNKTNQNTELTQKKHINKGTLPALEHKNIIFDQQQNSVTQDNHQKKGILCLIMGNLLLTSAFLGYALIQSFALYQSSSLLFFTVKSFFSANIFFILMSITAITVIGIGLYFLMQKSNLTTPNDITESIINNGVYYTFKQIKILNKKQKNVYEKSVIRTIAQNNALQKIFKQITRKKQELSTITDHSIIDEFQRKKHASI